MGGKRSKRAAAHFEMMMAFIFFVGFIFFVFSVLKPYGSQNLSDAVLEGAFISLEDYTKIPFTSFFLKAVPENSECFFITLDSTQFDFPFSKSKVFDSLGQEIPSKFSGNGLHVSGNKTFFFVHYSEEFSSQQISCEEEVINYTLGNIDAREVFSQELLKDLELLYYLDYDEAKQRLHIPGVYDFSIISEDLDIRMQGTIPLSAEVLAKEYVIEVLDAQTVKITTAKITVKVW